ncbi:hypothetical protein KFK09_014358 [Dendrobium nobile]|uniref:Uncharacterized protein n=1 Tax=Dendrobium nobile TaxID=94219 RepID=A0A8T3B9M6_DENNO|nr:hypothetical protein KFK09_014358 [Dendrobium nobile]
MGPLVGFIEVLNSIHTLPTHRCDAYPNREVDHFPNSRIAAAVALGTFKNSSGDINSGKPISETLIPLPRINTKPKF